MADNTLLARSGRASFNSRLPVVLPPKLPFTPTHWWDARDLTQNAGQAVTSWTDRVTGLALTNAVGGTKNLEGSEPYVGFSGTSGSLSVAGSLLPASEITSVIVIARPNVGDIAGGNGPILSHSTGSASAWGIFQSDAEGAEGDIARAFTNASGGSGFVPAYRGRWHVYMLAANPGGAGRFGVDGTSQLWTPDPAITTKVGLSLAISGASRRRIRIASVITTGYQMNANDMAETYEILRSNKAGLNW